jgi:type IV pilus assembly protein PilB
MPSLKERLSEILVTNRLISEEQLNTAIEYQKERGGRLSDILIELNFVKESDLITTLSESLGLPLIDLKRFKIDPETVKIVPIDIARHYQIIPVSRIGKSITLAMADPLNIFAIDHVAVLTGYKINPILAASQDINKAIEVSYPDQTRGLIDDLVKEISGPSLELIKEEKELVPSDQELQQISLEAPVVKITNMILEEAVKKRASDILIEPMDKSIRVRFRIDGILHEEQSPPKSMLQPIVSRVKVISNLDVAEHRLPQDGRFKVRILDREVDFRVSILPSSYGEKVSLRILDKSQATLDIERLGFSEDTVTKLKKVALLPHGLALVSGPTGSGKTTTLYSLLKFIDSPEKNIITVEDPVEYQLEGINQVTARQDIGLTFASALRSILRQDPNVIMVGEIRDYETVDIAVKSALTGHLVLSTLHTTTACGAIVRLVNMGVEPYLINAALLCVVAQRLVRRLCPYCREEYLFKKDIVKHLKLNYLQDKEIVFYRGRGCPKCFQLGYAGRVGIAETLLISPRIRELIIDRAQEHHIKALARQEGMKTLREQGLDLATQGVTTIEEVLRVTAPDE